MNRRTPARMLMLAVTALGLGGAHFGPHAFGDEDGAGTDDPSGWFISRAADAELRGAPASAPGYPVVELAPGTPLHLEGAPVDGWSMVRDDGPAFDDVRALVEVDGRLSVSDGTVTAIEPTTLFAINLRSQSGDGMYLPARSWMELATIDRGRSLPADRIFDMDGATWAIVTPPDGVRLWVNTAKVRPATETERLDIETTLAEAPKEPAPASVELREVLARPAATNPATASDAVRSPAAVATPTFFDQDMTSEGDWFVSNRNKLAVRSAPLDRPSYTVRTLSKEEPLLVVDIVDGSAVVALRGAIGDIPGILQLDGRVEVVDDVAHVVGPTEIRTPNLNAALEDGTYNPARCWQTMTEPQAGDTFKIRKRFTANNREWLMVSPPADVTFDVLLGQLRPARADEIPAPEQERAWPPRAEITTEASPEDVESDLVDIEAVELVEETPDVPEIDVVEIDTLEIAEETPDVPETEAAEIDALEIVEATPDVPETEAVEIDTLEIVEETPDVPEIEVVEIETVDETRQGADPVLAEPASEDILDLVDDPEALVVVEIIRDESGTIEEVTAAAPSAIETSERTEFSTDTPSGSSGRNAAARGQEWGEQTTPMQLPGGLSTRWGVSRSANLALRSEPSIDTGYVVGTVDRGDVVAVSGQEDDWLRVRLIGPELDDVRGLLRDQPGGFHAYGKRLRVVSGEHDVLAPNVRKPLTGVRSASGAEVADPASSWVPLTTLRPSDEIVTTDSFVDRNGTTWYMVIPPQNSEVWCHRAFLRPATMNELPTARGLDLAGRPNITDGGGRGERVADRRANGVGTDLLDSDEPASQPTATRRDMGEADIERPEVDVVETTTEAEAMEPEAVEIVEVDVVETTTEAGAMEPEAVEVVEIVEIVEADVVETTTEAGAMEPEELEIVEIVEVETITEAEATEPEAVEIVEIVEVDVVDVVEDAPPTADVEPIEVEPAPLPAELFEDINLDDAEAMWSDLRRGEKTAADLEAMRSVYSAIAARPSTGEAVRKRANLRRQQIEIQLKLQDRIESLRRLEDRNVADQERINAIREALLDRSNYNVIGRLSRSRVYDGRRLPRLYRLEDPTSGRTIAYVVPKDGLDLDQGLGRIVGIVGSERTDQTYGLRLVNPYRFEIDLSETIPAAK